MTTIDCTDTIYSVNQLVMPFYEGFIIYLPLLYFIFSVQNAPVMGPSLEPKVIPPPPDIQPIIDRMAMYVAKNGVEFEIVVRSKNDQRFEFLQPWHSYFRYYNSKKKIFIEVSSYCNRINRIILFLLRPWDGTTLQ